MFDWEQMLDSPPEWLENVLEDVEAEIETESEPSLGFI
jgi:hypothetical protein